MSACLVVDILAWVCSVGENSHDEERIKHLHAIQRRLDSLALFLFRRDGIACRKE